MKIAFHDNSLCLFGTTLAIKNWAFWGRELLGYEPIFLYNKYHRANNINVINTFNEEFNHKVFAYSDTSHIDKILSDNKCEYFFMEKSGRPDGVISTVSKNLINAIAICSANDIHGDVFAMGSEWLSKITNYQIPFVPYIVHLPDINTDLREDLNIPNDALVLGRNGGFETFDISFVKEAIDEVINLRSDLWFVFQCTEKFIDHPRIIFLPCSNNIEYKTKFINTCDAMLHARTVGESFGMACGEFSIRNKPIITWYSSIERSHIDILGLVGIYYVNKSDITNILLNISKSDINNKYWNCYTDYCPELVMKKFHEIYIDSR